MKLNQINPVQRTILAVTLSALAATPGVHASLALNNNLASLNASQSLQTSVDVLQQAGISQLSLANQSQQSVLNLLSDGSGQQVLAQANQGDQNQNSLQTLQQADQNNQQVLRLFGDGSQNLSIANQGLDQQPTVQLDPAKLMQSCQKEMRNATVQSVLSLFNGDNTVLVQQQQSLLSLIGGGSPAQSGVQTLSLANSQDQQGQQNQLSTGLKINSGADQNLSQSLNQLSTGLRINSPSEPVQAQDFQQARLQDLGRGLDFLMLADALNNRLSQSLAMDKSFNRDGLEQQLVALKKETLSSPYLFQCFQDMWNGDQQQVLQLIGGVNVQQAGGHSLLATPEPAMPMTFAACLGVALLALRKNRKMTMAE